MDGNPAGLFSAWMSFQSLLRRPNSWEYSVSEDLWPRAEGWRITMVYAAAEGYFGRIRPAQERVEEKWYSEELQMLVLQKVHTTFSGDSTMHLENINRAEPNLLMFQVPPGFTIKEP